MSGEIDPVTMVAKALLTDDSLGYAEIVIDHSEGAITLKGTVQNEQDRAAAEALAQEQEGVVQVINKLKVSEL